MVSIHRYRPLDWLRPDSSRWRIVERNAHFANPVRYRAVAKSSAREWASLLGPAGHRRSEREAVTLAREGLRLRWPLAGDSRGTQAKRLAPRNRSHGNSGVAAAEAVVLPVNNAAVPNRGRVTMAPAFAVLRQGGTVVTAMPHGVLFRGAVERAIRTCLLDDDCADAVIGLAA